MKDLDGDAAFEEKQRRMPPPTYTDDEDVTTTNNSIKKAEKITGIIPPIKSEASTGALKIFIPSIPVKVT